MFDNFERSRPCAVGECDYHSEHPPCDRGWLNADRVCPCWSARRRLDVHHTSLDVPGSTPMPAGIRVALRTAQKTSATAIPATLPWVPKTRRAPEPVTGAEPEPDDDRVVQVLLDLKVEPFGTAATLVRVKVAIGAALNRGWQPEALVEYLDGNRGPDPDPIRYWTWTLGRIGTATQLESTP